MLQLAATLRSLAARANLPLWRLGLVATLLAAYLVGQTYQVFTDGDDWPMSSYPMYRGVQGPFAVKHLLRGVSPEGEFDLARAHTWPLTSVRMRHVTARLNQPRHRDAFGVFIRRYHEKRQDHPEWPELVGLRLYDLVWKIRPGLMGIERTRRRLESAVLALSPRTEQALRAEAQGEAAPPSPQPASAGDIVLDAGEAELHGGLQRVSDRYAYQGVALRFQDGPRRAPPKHPNHAARFRFEAEPGDYYVWLRGKSTKGERADSVWLQFDNPTRRSSNAGKHGMGNFRQGLPAGAFAWSSARPAQPPARVRLKGGPQELVITPREGPVTIDQIVLSRSWRERPAQEGPVAQ